MQRQPSGRKRAALVFVLVITVLFAGCGQLADLGTTDEYDPGWGLAFHQPTNVSEDGATARFDENNSHIIIRGNITDPERCTRPALDDISSSRENGSLSVVIGLNETDQSNSLQRTCEQPNTTSGYELTLVFADDTELPKTVTVRHENGPHTNDTTTIERIEKDKR